MRFKLKLSTNHAINVRHFAVVKSSACFRTLIPQLFVYGVNENTSNSELSDAFSK